MRYVNSPVFEFKYTVFHISMDSTGTIPYGIKNPTNLNLNSRNKIPHDTARRKVPKFKSLNTLVTILDAPAHTLQAAHPNRVGYVVTVEAAVDSHKLTDHLSVIHEDK